jgi:hypothetical protein
MLFLLGAEAPALCGGKLQVRRQYSYTYYLPLTIDFEVPK